jgi:MFS family permease
MDLIAYLAGRYFGMAHYGKIYGMLYMPFGIAAAISPAAYGWVRDSFGNYNLALQTAMLLFLFGAFILLTLGRYPDLSKEAVTSS